MACFKIEEPNKKTKWIKTIDEANGTLTFTNNRVNVYQRGSGIVSRSVIQFLKFHFMESYPELQYLKED